MSMPNQTENVAPVAASAPPVPSNQGAKLTPAQIARIREKALEAGIALDQGPCQLLADGSIKITVLLPSEVAIPLKTWAETANEPIHEFIEKNIIQAVTGYVFSDFGATAV